MSFNTSAQPIAPPRPIPANAAQGIYEATTPYGVRYYRDTLPRAEWSREAKRRARREQPGVLAAALEAAGVDFCEARRLAEVTWEWGASAPAEALAGVAERLDCATLAALGVGVVRHPDGRFGLEWPKPTL